MVLIWMAVVADSASSEFQLTHCIEKESLFPPSSRTPFVIESLCVNPGRFLHQAHPELKTTPLSLKLDALS